MGHSRAGETIYQVYNIERWDTGILHGLFGDGVPFLVMNDELYNHHVGKPIVKTYHLGDGLYHP